MVVGPGLYKWHARSTGSEILALPGPAGKVQAHQVTAVSTVPGEFREGIGGTAVRLVEVVIHAAVAESLAHEGVEAGSGAGLPFLRQVDVPEESGVVWIVGVHWPQQLEHGAGV